MNEMIDELVRLQNYTNYCQYYVSNEETLDLIKEIYKYLMVFPLKCGKCNKMGKCDCDKTYIRKKNLYVARHYKQILQRFPIEILSILDVFIDGEDFKFYKYKHYEDHGIQTINVNLENEDILIVLSLSTVPTENYVYAMVLNLCHKFDIHSSFEHHYYNPNVKMNFQSSPSDRAWIHAWKFNYVLLKKILSLLKNIYIKYTKK